MTMLVCMTEQRAIVHTNEGDRPLTEICAELLANPAGASEAIYEAAGIWWPNSIAIEAAQLAAGLICPRRRGERTPVEAIRQSLEALAAASDLPAGVVDASAASSRHCLVCMDAIRTVRFAPCGHSVCCDACANLVVTRGDPCPNCRSQIDRIHSCGAHVADEDTYMDVSI